jgi:hypothetical protein
MLQYPNNLIHDKTFIKGVLVAVLVALLTKVGQWLWDLFRQAWQSRNSFDIGGIWVGDCWLPSYGDKELEIWRYWRKGDAVKLKFFTYNAGNAKPRKWIGGGIYRGTKLSAYYYLLAADTYESGVVVLELKALQLKGAYAQFDPKVKEEPLYVSKIDYAQSRIKLALGPRIKMILGFPPFRTYAEVKALCGKCTL